MKKLFILLFVFCAANTFAQKKVADYHSDYFEKDYEICITTAKNDPSTISDVYIDVAGERSSETVTLNYESPYSLLSSLKEVRDKYAEWVKVAEENDITEMTKEIPVDMPSVIVCWYTSKWNFSYKKRFKFTFMILDSGKKVIVMNEKVTSTANQYIDTKFYWVFQSVTELDEFIELMNYPKFIEKLNVKANNADLFQ